MKVKEIVLAAAKLLGIGEGVGAYFDGANEELKREAELLVECFNMVESELALDYLPLYAEDELKTTTGRLEFDMFQYAPVRILRVEDEAGDSVKFTLYPKYLKAQAGVLKVTYTYTPEKKDVDGESDFGVLVSERMFAYGVLTEYCTAEGLFEEASVWDKKYKEAIEAACRKRPCERLNSRRWV